MHTGRKAMYMDPSICHICELPIPDGVVSERHPLFGTVDHVIPLSRGGANGTRNRAPAHFYCNRYKGNRLAVEEKSKRMLRDRIAAMLRGFPLSKRQRLALRRGTMTPLRGGTGPAYIQLMKWEDDGGLPAPEWL